MRNIIDKLIESLLLSFPDIDRAEIEAAILRTLAYSPVYRFFLERCWVTHYDICVSASDIYKEYCDWCKLYDVPPINKGAFYSIIKRDNMTVTKGNRLFLRGVRIMK